MSQVTDIMYCVVESKPKDKNEYAMFDGTTRVDFIRASLDGTKFILKYDSKKKPKPDYPGAKLKVYDLASILKETQKKDSEWEEEAPFPVIGMEWPE